MQKSIMAVTGDETGKNLRERFKFCKIILEVLKNYLWTSEYFKSIAFLVAEEFYIYAVHRHLSVIGSVLSIILFDPRQFSLFLLH